jgi:hypothetical protein
MNVDVESFQEAARLMADREKTAEQLENEAIVAYHGQRLQQRLALIGVERHQERIGFPSLVGPELPRPARRSKGFG